MLLEADADTDFHLGLRGLGFGGFRVWGLRFRVWGLRV